MKLCINCKHHVTPKSHAGFDLPDIHMCGYQRSPVHGGIEDNWRSKCEEQRDMFDQNALIVNACGASGRWFEPK